MLRAFVRSPAKLLVYRRFCRALPRARGFFTQPLCSCPATDRPKPHVIEISAHEFAVEIKRPGLLALDVRSVEERESALGYIPKTEHVDLSMIINDTWKAPHKSTPIVFVCRSGVRSRTAANVMLERGFTNVFNLTGGTLAWAAAGLPRITQETPQSNKDQATKTDA